MLKELNESRVWLKMIIRTDMAKEKQLEDLLDENDQLCRIISASINTARSNS